MKLPKITFLMCIMQAHPPPKIKYYCGKCGSSFDSYYALKVHRRETKACHDPLESVVIDVFVNNQEPT